MITAGVDIGSLTGKVVILKDNEILSWSLIRTSPESEVTARRAMDEALNKAGLSLEDIEYVVSTGYGRVVVPFARKNITEISCHAKGTHWFFPNVKTLLDMGGQDCKAVRVNDTGKVENFAMNDKCAAGTGRSMEVMASLLGILLEDIGRFSLETTDGPVYNVSSICVVYAKSEVLNFVRRGVPRNDVLAGLCNATAERVRNLLSIVGTEEEFAISGGIAKNIGVVKRVEQKVGMKANICFEPQIVGALGAALFARERLEKGLP